MSCGSIRNPGALYMVIFHKGELVLFYSFCPSVPHLLQQNMKKNLKAAFKVKRGFYLQNQGVEHCLETTLPKQLTSECDQGWSTLQEGATRRNIQRTSRWWSRAKGQLASSRSTHGVLSAWYRFTALPTQDMCSAVTKQTLLFSYPLRTLQHPHHLKVNPQKSIPSPCRVITC